MGGCSKITALDDPAQFMGRQRTRPCVSWRSPPAQCMCAASTCACAFAVCLRAITVLP